MYSGHYVRVILYVEREFVEGYCVRVMENCVG
jgi:hypothetical protein